MVVYAVEEWGRDGLRDYWLCSLSSLAMILAAGMGRRVLDGAGELHALDYEGIEIPIRSIPTVLRLGKSVEITQDWNYDSVKIVAYNAGG